MFHFASFASLHVFNQRSILLFITITLLSFPVLSKDKVVMGVLAGREIDRNIYLEYLTRFQSQYPDIEFDHIAADDKGYKSEVSNWLTRKKVDVSYGQSGSRLCQLAVQGKIAKLDNIWHQQNWDKQFSSNFKQAVTCNNHVYGIPIIYYYWGFFYKKSLFERLKISPPETWEQMLSTFAKLQAEGIQPVTIGTKNNWPAAAWFDYFNLRINGLDFHQQLLKGQHSFLAPEVRKVMKHWLSLLNQNIFIKSKRQMDWQQALPYLYRDMAGMILTGSFLINILPDKLRDDIGFFRFPIIDKTLPVYEEVPTDVYVLNQLSKDNPGAKSLLNFAVAPDTQAWMANALGYLPPNQHSTIANNYFSKLGQQHVEAADGYSQYFDRDANFALADKGMRVLANFMENKDIDQALNQLEIIRLSSQID